MKESKKTILSPELFTPQQQKMIDEFLDKNSALMDDLRELEERERAVMGDVIELEEKEKIDKQPHRYQYSCMSSLSPKCKTPDKCISEQWPLCFDCNDVLEEYAIQSALNMGAPDQFGCGICGNWYLNEDFFKHPCIANANT